MMKKKVKPRVDKYPTKLDAARVITRNRGTVSNKLIYCTAPGIKVLGAIDYLVNNHGMKYVSR